MIEQTEEARFIRFRIVMLEMSGVSLASGEERGGGGLLEIAATDALTGAKAVRNVCGGSTRS